MSQENLEIVRHIVEGWARGDFSVTDGFHPDVEFDLVDWPERARAKGMDEMRRTWFATLSAWDDYRSPAVDFIERGPHVVVTFDLHARGKTSGAVVDADTAAVFTLDAAKVVRLALYWSRTKALKVVGLAE